MAGHNLLHIAALQGAMGVMGFALDRKIHIDSADLQGNTALHLAVLSGSLEAVSLLVDKHAKSLPNR
jgi:ankyrin repeat protein